MDNNLEKHGVEGTPAVIIDKNVKTDDILYKPKWWRWDSWKFHAFIIMTLIMVSTSILSALSVVYPIMFGMNTQIVYNSANIALNWTALAYAIYIYKIYDDTKQKATAKLQESGIEPISIEEGLGDLLHQVKKASKWIDDNHDSLEKIYNVSKKLDLEKIIGSLEELSKMLESMQEHGFNKERFEKLFIMFEKIDLDKAIGMVDDWNKGQEKMRMLDKAESEMLPAPLPVPQKVCQKHIRVILDENGICGLCEKERRENHPAPPLRRGGLREG